MEKTLELYTVQVFTGDSRGLGGDAVSIRLTGTKGSSNDLHLKADCGHSNKLFKKGKVDEFKLVTEDLGNLKEMTVMSQGHLRHSWFCEQMEVGVNGKVYRAKFSQCMEAEESCELELISSPGPMILGPILRVRATNDALWKISALVVLDSQVQPCGLSYFTALSRGSVSVGANFVVKIDNCTLWRYDLEIPLTGQSQICTYRIGDREYQFEVPASDEQPKMAFGSHLDVRHPYHQQSIEEKDLMWNYIAKEHATQRYHLLLLGGNQVNCDGIFMCSPSFQEWSSHGQRERCRSTFTARMKAEARCFYSKIYLRTWSQPGISNIFAQIPTVMMWDDGDIYAGFGSYDPRYGTCDVLAGLFPFARKAFFNFQQQGDSSSAIHRSFDDDTGPFSRGFLLPGNVALLSLDVRSERFMRSHTEGQVLSPESWRDLKDWFHQIRQSEIRHLFVMSAVAVIRPHRNIVEKIYERLYTKKGERRDPWPSRIHGSEGIFLLNLLSRFASGEHGQSKVTILAGDFRSMSQSIIEDPQGRIQIKQIVSSAIGEARPQLSHANSLRCSGSFNFGHFKGKLVRMPSGQWFDSVQNFTALVPSEQSYIGRFIARPDSRCNLHAMPPAEMTDVSL